MIYLDNHSAARPCSAAIERMQPFLQEHWGAGFAPHRMGQELIVSLDSRYQAIYGLFGADLKEKFVFTSSGAEAVNQVLLSVFLEQARKEGKCHFITTSLEDAPTMQMMQRLEELGCFVKIVSVDRSGRIDLDQLRSLINPRTAMVSATMADGLTGVLQPSLEIARICQELGVLLHLDATYAVGKLDIAFSDLGVDYLTFSGDRMHALKSSGGLFAKEKSTLSPLIAGGSEQNKLRGGAFDVPSFMALAAAAGQSQLFLDTMGLETVRLRDLLEYELMKKIPGAFSVFEDQLRLPNTAVVSFPKIHAESLLYLLNRKNVFASLGGFYSQHLHRLLQAMGVEERTAENSLHFSLSRYTTEEEITRAVAVISEAVLYLRTVSEDLF